MRWTPAAILPISSALRTSTFWLRSPRETASTTRTMRSRGRSARRSSQNTKALERAPTTREASDMVRMKDWIWPSKRALEKPTRNAPQWRPSTTIGFEMSHAHSPVSRW
ncbi:hypothetical protein D3C86_1929690 [compost metagenome]